MVKFFLKDLIMDICIKVFIMLKYFLSYIVLMGIFLNLVIMVRVFLSI